MGTSVGRTRSLKMKLCIFLMVVAFPAAMISITTAFETGNELEDSLVDVRFEEELTDALDNENEDDRLNLEDRARKWRTHRGKTAKKGEHKGKRRKSGKRRSGGR